MEALSLHDAGQEINILKGGRLIFEMQHRRGTAPTHASPRLARITHEVLFVARTFSMRLLLLPPARPSRREAIRRGKARRTVVSLAVHLYRKNRPNPHFAWRRENWLRDELPRPAAAREAECNRGCLEGCSPSASQRAVRHGVRSGHRVRRRPTRQMECWCKGFGAFGPVLSSLRAQRPRRPTYRQKRHR